ncbi:MAG: toxin-antitoxin system YwqK family antitoxin [Rufibacter sp.]
MKLLQKPKINCFALLVCLGLWGLLPLTGQSMVWPWKWNQVDKDGNRHGKWRTYYEHKPEQLMYTGKFRHGKEKGVWRTYSDNGQLERLEKYEPTKRKGSRVSNFWSMGKITFTPRRIWSNEKSKKCKA